MFEYAVRPSGLCASVRCLLTPITRDEVSLYSVRGISTKLGKDTHHASGHR